VKSTHLLTTGTNATLLWWCVANRWKSTT